MILICFLFLTGKGTQDSGIFVRQNVEHEEEEEHGENHETFGEIDSIK